MKSCDFCQYFYSDRSGRVCNAFHSIASVDQAEQCQDFEVKHQQIDSPSSQHANILRFERVYFDGTPPQPLPFAAIVDNNGIMHTISDPSCDRVSGQDPFLVQRIRLTPVQPTRLWPQRTTFEECARISATIILNRVDLDLTAFKGHSELRTDLACAVSLADIMSQHLGRQLIPVANTYILTISNLPVNVALMQSPTAAHP